MPADTLTDSEQAAVLKVLQLAADYVAVLKVESIGDKWEADLWWEGDEDEDGDPCDGGDVGTGPTPLAAIVDLAGRL